MKHRIKGLAVIIFAFLALMGWMAVDDRNKAAPIGHCEAVLFETAMSSFAIWPEAPLTEKYAHAVPDERLRDEIFTAVREGKVCQPRDIKERPANSSSDGAGVIFRSTAKDGKSCVGFGLYVHVLTDRRMSRIVKASFVAHEWVHVKQSLDGDYPVEFATGVQIKTRREFNLFVETEMAAYTTQCDMLLLAQTERELDYCDLYHRSGPDAMHRGFITMMLRRHPSLQYLD